MATTVLNVCKKGWRLNEMSTSAAPLVLPAFGTHVNCFGAAVELKSDTFFERDIMRVMLKVPLPVEPGNRAITEGQEMAGAGESYFALQRSKSEIPV